MQKTPTIFLSYCRANADVADAIDNDFKAIGITFRRDIRDVAYRSNIKDFMNIIGESDFVLMLISDEFLKSDWCMYEVTELLNTHKFHDKILPIILENANPVFKLKGRLPYYEYWNNQVEEHNQLLAKLPNADLIEVIRRYKNVVNRLDTFFTNITELNQLSIETLKLQNYRPILELVDFDDKSLLEEVLAIWRISDQEEKEIALEVFGSKYPTNQHYLFAKALFEGDQKKFKKSRKSYEEALRINPKHADAHYNLGILLKNNFQEYEAAKIYYEEALRINPDHADVHNSLGILLGNNFQEYEAAKTHYLEALRINPNYADAHYNLAILLADNFNEYKRAITHYLKSLLINPNNANAHNNLAILLMENFKNYEGAKTHYLEALRIDPNYENAHYNLGTLLMENTQEYEGAKTHYLEALRINPDNAFFHNNLGTLLKNNFKDYEGAERHYEEALSINPELAAAHYNLALLLKANLNNRNQAKKHYVLATELNPDLIDEEDDTYYGIER